MLNAFYAAVKGVDPGNVVITAGNSPYGDEPSSDRMRPLRFDRELFCLRENLKPAGGCDRANFDVFAHHPINTSGGPRLSAVHPDDASTSDFKNVVKTLRAAERARTVGTASPPGLGDRDLVETNPPDAVYGVGQQARWIEDALYTLWKQGAKKVFYLLIRDPPFAPETPGGEIHSGLFFTDGTAKPSAQAFAFPFVTERKSKDAARLGQGAQRG